MSLKNSLLGKGIFIRINHINWYYDFYLKKWIPYKNINDLHLVLSHIKMRKSILGFT